ncbi:MAG: hypothetical protein JXR70_09665, partial [Spirochaetales bacterium]|nr:hypothetical protein [Spirochaetales bacterium]
KWSSDKATVGEEVTLSVNIQSQQGLRGGVQFKIYADGADPKIDPPVATKSVRKDKGLAEVKWRYQYIPGDEPLTEKPKFFFEAWAFRCEKVKSGLVEMGAKFETLLQDPFHGILADHKYKLTIPGTDFAREGTSDSDGKVKEKDLPPGKFEIAPVYEENNGTAAGVFEE